MLTCIHNEMRFNNVLFDVLVKLAVAKCLCQDAHMVCNWMLDAFYFCQSNHELSGLSMVHYSMGFLELLNPSKVEGHYLKKHWTITKDMDLWAGHSLQPTTKLWDWIWACSLQLLEVVCNEAIKPILPLNCLLSPSKTILQFYSFYIFFEDMAHEEFIVTKL